MRISGLASGFDTDEMVKQLMQVERLKVDRVEQDKQILLWKQEQYNSMNKDFANFILNSQKDMGLKKTSSTGTMLNGTYKNLDYVKKAESSNENVATVRSSGTTTNGSFEIKVAEGGVPRNANFTSAKITDDFFAAKVEDPGKEAIKEMTFKINGHDVNVSTEKEQLTMDDVVRAINNTKIRTYKGQEITKETFDELDDSEKKNVKVTSLEVNAFYDKGTGRIFLESSENIDKKDDFKIEITGSESGEAFAKAMNGEGHVSVSGSKGKVTINDVPVDVKNGKVNFNGLEIDIKAEGTTRINVSTNTQEIMEKIEKLVADYNELVDKASGAVGEKRYSSYRPLSSEEKKAMTEDDVKLWEEKAKSGLLNRDSTLERTLQTIRLDLYKTLEGATGTYNHITQIGISTERYSQGSAGGKLQIDTEKLRKAIEQDAEGVMELLFKEGNIVDGKEVFETTGKTSDLSTKGIFTRVYDDLIDGMKDIIDKSGPGNDGALYRGIKSNMLIDFVTKKGSISDLDKSVAEMNRQIDNLNILLAKKEDSHYAKFTAMEKAMYQMQNQSSWLAQQFM